MGSSIIDLQSPTPLQKFMLRFTYCECINIYEGWNFNSGNYLFTTDTK